MAWMETDYSKPHVLSMEDKMTAGTCALGIMGEALEDPQLISEQS